MHPTKRAQLHSSFASQLESVGLWQWAVFVLLHLDDLELRRWAVQELLSRRCSEREELVQEEVFVIEKLRVPVEWVYQAKVHTTCKIVSYMYLYVFLYTTLLICVS